MYVLDGQWYMEGIDWDDEGCIHSSDELLSVIESVGFLPLFSSGVPGFSVEEMTDTSCWWCGDVSVDPWEWRAVLARTGKVAYGKFYGGRAGFISKKWFPYFANYRRDGYDFDARFEDGLVYHGDKLVYDLINSNAPILSKRLKQMGNYRKGGNKGFDTIINRLQAQGYVIISDFRYMIDKDGREYGWGVAEYSTPEHFMGESFRKNVYNCTPEESYEILFGHLRDILPGADEASLRRFLK